MYDPSPRQRRTVIIRRVRNIAIIRIPMYCIVLQCTTNTGTSTARWIVYDVVVVEVQDYSTDEHLENMTGGMGLNCNQLHSKTIIPHDHIAVAI